MKCQKCGFDNTPGALLCNACSEPLEVDVGTAAAKSSDPVSGKSAGFSGTAGSMHVLSLIEGGKRTDREVEIPEDNFEFLFGRTDLGEGIIPEVDLTKFGEKVTIEGQVGYTFSRKQALVSRRAGMIFMKALGDAKTMHFSATTKEWKEIPKDKEVELALGDKVRFGGSEGYVIFELAEQRI